MITAAEVIGNISAWKMPFNVQNLVGNWLMLVGQAIVTFNAQQQLCMGGPGRCYGELEQQAEKTIDELPVEKQVAALSRQVAELQQVITRGQSTMEWQLWQQLCRSLTEAEAGAAQEGVDIFPWCFAHKKKGEL